MSPANVPGRWIREVPTWRRISLATWSRPDNATIYGLHEIDVGPLLDFLEARSAASGEKCTVTHAATRAIGLALRLYPEANVLVRHRRLWQRDTVDVFVLVAMQRGDRAGRADLSGALIRNADQKRVEAIAGELARKAQAVRDEKDEAFARTRRLLKVLPIEPLGWIMKALAFLQYDLNLELPGMERDGFGGATVTSVGMLGVKQAFTPLTTFTRCSMLALVGKVEDKPVVRDGRVVARPMCTVTGSFDHRVFDGVLAGRVADSIQRILEEPALLDASPEELEGALRSG
jgi:pyruvate/2-oxoglutarate dehydrogenase complex dihydrolipoamide acyltransferase (E2) component